MTRRPRRKPGPALAAQLAGRQWQDPTLNHRVFAPMGKPDECVERSGTQKLGSAELSAVVKDLVTRVGELQAENEALRKDAERWRWAKAGLFITPHPMADGLITVVYASGRMDEFAQEMYPSLLKDERQLVRDVTPVFDAAIAHSGDSNERPDERRKARR